MSTPPLDDVAAFLNTSAYLGRLRAAVVVAAMRELHAPRPPSGAQVHARVASGRRRALAQDALADPAGVAVRARAAVATLPGGPAHTAAAGEPVTDEDLLAAVTACWGQLAGT